MMQSLGYENSAWQVAELYHDLAATIVIDDVDAALAGRIAKSGVRPIVTDTIMRRIFEKAALAKTALDAALRR